MKRRRGCLQWSAIVIIVMLVLLLVVLGGYAVLRLRQEQLQAQFVPPSVTITHPDSGTSTQEGNHLAVSATAFGRIPITRMELWVDNEVVDTQMSRDPAGVSPFTVAFDWTVPQGLHTLFVRAVDATGLIGDSWPVNVGGVERPGPNDPALLVTVEAGETVEDIAAAHDVDPETVRELNPGLVDEEPPEGSEVVLPPPRSQGEPVPEGPPVGPTLPTSDDQPPGGATTPPPTGPPLAVLNPTALVDIGPLLDLLAAGSPPKAPTDLKAEVSGCNVQLTWRDNADNEGQYQVWYLWNLGYDARKIAELEPAAGGQVWFELPAPGSGLFIFWVEAANIWGSQPSNKVGALVAEGDCPQTMATHLQVEVLDMAVPAGNDDAYCYLSFEGGLPVRVPEESFFNDFVQSALWGDNFPVAPVGEGTLVVPIPGDGSLEVESEWWAWPDGKLTEIGRASGQYPRNTWDGQRVALAGSGVEIGLAIRPLEGALDTSGQMTTFSYDDPSIPVPYDVLEDRVRSFNPVDPLLRSVRWKWGGDPSTISGFQVLLNGVPYNSGGGWSLVDPMGRSARVMLPQECGGHISWQVRAVAGEAQSRLSPLTLDSYYDLPPCDEYVMVTFHSILFQMDCDSHPGWFLELNGQAKQFHDSCDAGAFEGCMIRGGRITDCGLYSFASLGEGMDPHPDTIVVPLSPGEIKAEIKVAVWDRMSGDMVAAFWKPRYFSSLAEAQQEVGCGLEGELWDVPPWANVDYTLYIFPQPAGMDCPVSNPAYLP